MIKISSLSLFIINRVVYRSYVLGILQEKLSLVLGKRSTYVNSIRSEKNDAIFSPIDYPLIASALDWETHDLLPPANTPYSDGTLVEKVVFSLSNPSDAKEVLLGMKENEYFDSPKSINDIHEHLYLPHNKATAVKRQVILNELTILVKDGVLKLNNRHYTI